jgi:hypothetical protein
MYLLVRGDLTPGAQLAQAVHAATALSLEQPGRVAATPTVVVLHVDDEDELLDYADLCCPPRGDAVLFHEPDLPGHTALAVISDGAVFSRLRLAGGVMV